MADELINCIDCKTDFTFTEGEQKFYAEKQLSKPRRCKACRQARKAAKDSSGSAPEQESNGGQRGRSNQWVNGSESEGGGRGRRDSRSNGRRGGRSSRGDDY